MRKLRWTLVGAALAIVIKLAALLLGLDLFERMVTALAALERFEVDELIIPAVIFLAFAFLDLIKKQEQQKVAREKLAIYSAMLASTHHILNNFLNQMQLFKMTARNTPGFDAEVLSLYDVVIEGASDQIEALSEVTEIDEASIRASVEPSAAPPSAAGQA